MSWGITINNVSLYGAKIDGLQSMKEELEIYMAYSKEQIMMFASHSPNCIEEEWMLKLHSEIDELLSEYADNYYKLGLVNTALENPEDVEEF